MNAESTLTLTAKQLGKGFVFSLALAVFGTSMLDVLSSLFLADLARTFIGDSSLASIAIISQIVTISSIAAVIFGLLNSALSVRLNRKALLLLGALSIVVGSIGCFLAPSLLYMQIFYPFDGVGTIVVTAMALALIGEYMPLEKRAKSVGIVAGAGIFSSAVGFTFAGYIGAAAGWRSYLLWYVLPISLAALGLAYFLIPDYHHSEQEPITNGNLFDSFKEILANKSATACLTGYALMGMAAMWSFFAATFWAKVYSIPVQNIGTLMSMIIVLHALGSVVGGRIVDSLGRKTTVIFSWIIRGLLVASIAMMPNFWFAFSMAALFMFVGGISVSSGHSLNLEQVRKSRGTMMSLSIVFANIGASLGAVFGSLVLGTYGFQIVGIIFGLINVAAALTVLILSKDPSKSNESTR